MHVQRVGKERIIFNLIVIGASSTCEALFLRLKRECDVVEGVNHLQRQNNSKALEGIAVSVGRVVFLPAPAARFPILLTARSGTLTVAPTEPAREIWHRTQ